APALVRSRADLERRAVAQPADEGAVDRVGERVEETEPPGTGQERLLGGIPVAGVPVPLDEALRELPRIVEVVEELEHPVRPAERVPSEGRRRELLLEVPGEVEGVHAVEQAEVVALAPDDLLATRAEGEGNRPQ